MAAKKTQAVHWGVEDEITPELAQWHKEHNPNYRNVEAVVQERLAAYEAAQAPPANEDAPAAPNQRRRGNQQAQEDAAQAEAPAPEAPAPVVEEAK